MNKEEKKEYNALFRPNGELYGCYINAMKNIRKYKNKKMYLKKVYYNVLVDNYYKMIRLLNVLKIDYELGNEHFDGDPERDYIQITADKRCKNFAKILNEEEFKMIK